MDHTHSAQLLPTTGDWWLGAQYIGDDIGETMTYAPVVAWQVDPMGAARAVAFGSAVGRVLSPSDYALFLICPPGSPIYALGLGSDLQSNGRIYATPADVEADVNGRQRETDIRAYVWNGSLLE